MKRYIRTALILLLALLMPLCGIGVNLLHCRHSGRVWMFAQVEGLQNQHCKQAPASKENNKEASQFEMPPCMDLHQFQLDVKAIVSTETVDLPSPIWLLLPFWVATPLGCDLKIIAFFLPRGGGTAIVYPLPARELLARICTLRI